MQNSNVIWENGVPVSARFDDPYFSDQDGLAEARHVFLAGNALPDRFCADFQIAELGFGTGLNLLATWQAWEKTGHTTPLNFNSFEAEPLSKVDMEKSLSYWPELADDASRFLKAYDVKNGANLPTLNFNLVIGDVNDTLPNWQGRADAWFLDGFSPAKNPEMWSADVLQQVASHSNPHATCATYTAAGHVRRNLAKAGFDVARVQGFGRKRHMTTARLSHDK